LLASAEVDLIFPRNNTYAPTALTPVVFAVQTPQLSALLHLQVTYYISSVDGNNASGSGGLDMKSANFSSSSLHFAYKPNDFLNTEGTWIFIWEAFVSNCSQGITPAGLTQSNHVFFTIKNGAQQPELVAATADNTCAGNQSFTFNVTGSVNASGFSADLPTPTAIPCTAKINPSAASSISLAMSSNACAATHPATASCRPVSGPVKMMD
jgi:hypothetical protein